MKPAERDDLLIRLDERTNNIWRVVETLEAHQADQNGFIRENTIATAKNTSWRKTSKWLLGIGFTVLIATVGIILGIINI